MYFGGDYVLLPRGGIGELTAEIDAWREAGGTHVSVVTMHRGLGLRRRPHRLPRLARTRARPGVTGAQRTSALSGSVDLSPVQPYSRRAKRKDEA
jgi:hypothetical protein